MKPATKFRLICLGIGLLVGLIGLNVVDSYRPEWFASPRNRAFNEHYQEVDRPMVLDFVKSLETANIDTTKVRKACLKAFMTEQDANKCIAVMVDAVDSGTE